MAEIKIKKKTTVWPWVLLLLLIIAGILYYLYYMGDDSYTSEDSNIEQLEDDPYIAPSEDASWDENTKDSL